MSPGLLCLCRFKKAYSLQLVISTVRTILLHFPYEVIYGEVMFPDDSSDSDSSDSDSSSHMTLSFSDNRNKNSTLVLFSNV